MCHLLHIMFGVRSVINGLANTLPHNLPPKTPNERRSGLPMTKGPRSAPGIKDVSDSEISSRLRLGLKMAKST